MTKEKEKLPVVDLDEHDEDWLVTVRKDREKSKKQAAIVVDKFIKEKSK